MSTDRTTLFSQCRKWRYTLWRGWDSDDLVNGRRYVQFIGLNPSTADEQLDDQTVRRCIRFSRDWGYGAFCMTNLFAWRDTHPENMKIVSDPVGPDNDSHLEAVCKGAGLIVAAWGKHGKFMYRDVKFKAKAREWGVTLHCLGLNSDGTPKHPLYQKGTLKPVVFV